VVVGAPTLTQVTRIDPVLAKVFPESTLKAPKLIVVLDAVQVIAARA
jgi:hypothetical protein